MNEVINLQLQFFGVSILWGAILLVIYDVLRIFRRIVKHGRAWVALEDMIFWTISGILIFKMMYQQNNGIIRGFSIMGMAIGMIVYNKLLSNHLVKGISFGIHKIFEFIKKVIHFLTSPLRFLLRKVRVFLEFILKGLKKSGRFIGKALKKILRTVKIILTKQ